MANCLPAYYDEQEKALEFIRESPELTIDEKKRFFKSANTNFGTEQQICSIVVLTSVSSGISALCLSGGASFGYCEYG